VPKNEADLFLKIVHFFLVAIHLDGAASRRDLQLRKVITNNIEFIIGRPEKLQWIDRGNQYFFFCQLKVRF